MSRYLFLFFFLANPLFVRTQPLPDSLRLYLDTVINLAQAYSVYTDNVPDWNQLRQALHEQATGARQLGDLMPAFETLYRELKDFHGAVHFQNRRYNRYYKLEAPLPIDQQAWQEIQSGRIPLRAARLAGRYGYIAIPLIPAFDQETIERYAHAIRDSVDRLASTPVDGWIVDLRRNGGGNMYPMLTGLAALLGDGPVGGTVDNRGAGNGEWSIRSGNFFWNDYQTTHLDAPAVDGKADKVVVILGRYTCSSGEALAVAFRGRPNTLFIGEQTTGYSTSNSWRVLREDFIVQFAEGYFRDRQGGVYKDGLIPDRYVIDGDDYDNLTADRKIQEAIRWLRGK